MKKHMNPPCFITDPFKEDELIVSDTGEVMISEIRHVFTIYLKNIKTFRKSRLIICDVAL